MALLFPADFSWTFAQVAWVLAALHFVRQLTLTSEALLRMDFEFGRLSLLHGLGTLLALSSALLAARAGWEEWSLILGGWTTYSVLSVVYVLFFSAATWYSRPLPLRRTSLRFDWVWARRLLGYGVWIWVGWVLQVFIWWYDKLVVRLVAGDTALALYETAWWLVQIPTAVIAHIILNYSSTLYSRYRHERERLGELFSKMISLVLRVSAPVSLILVFNAREITALLGSQWAASAHIVVWLAAYALLRPLLSDGFSLLWAVGATRRSAYIVGMQGAVALFAVPAMGVVWGAEGVASSMGAVAGAGFCGLCVGLRPYVRVNWFKILAGPAVGLLAAAVCGWLYARWALDYAVGDFVLRSGIMALAYGAVLGLLERRTIVEELGRLRRIMRGSKEANH